MMIVGLCLILCASFDRLVYGTTDPELLEQLWNQLYRYLPGPSVSPQLPSELSLSVDVAVSVDNVELIRSHNGPACRASLTVLTEWPVTDARVAESRLVELMHGAVRLDVNRVWHPELVFAGSYRVQKLAQRLELRADASNTNKQEITNSKAPSPMLRSASKSHSNRLSSNFSPRQPTEDNQKAAGRSQNRMNMHISGTGSEGPRYVYIESLAIEVTCHQPEKWSQIANILCPILIRQGGLMHVQPSIKWTERKSCLITANVERRISHITVTRSFGQHIDRQGVDHSLRITICFSQTSRIIRYSLAPVLIVLASFIILWTGPIGTHVMTWIQLTLLGLLTTLWIWSGGQDIGVSGRPELLDIWLLLCLIAVCFTSCLAILEQRWSTRILRQRQRRCLRAPSFSLLQNKTATVPNTPALNVNPAIGSGCFQGCTCGGSSSGTCPDNCMNCAGIQGRASTGFVSPNGTIGVYCSNSSCGASGHVCAGMGTHGQGNSAGNSPAPMGFNPQPMTLSTAKMDTYTDGFICPNSVEPRNGGPVGTFRGLRWRPISASRRNNTNPNTGIELPDCQACLCHATPPANLIQQPGSPVPPYNSACSSISSHVPTNCCLKSLKTALTVATVLIGAIFWITVLAMGTIPDACLGASICQSMGTNYLK